MRYYVFLVLLMSAVMVGLITWATRPDLLQAQYDWVAAPIEQHFAAKRAGRITKVNRGAIRSSHRFLQPQ